MNSYIVEADGGSRGNPGLAGSGAVIIDALTGELIVEISKFIGIATNNVAEYVAIESALEKLSQLTQGAQVEIKMDSKLVIEQMAGRWKIKHPDMIELGRRVQQLARQHTVNWTWIPREKNSRADELANLAMDSKSDFIGLRSAAPETKEAPYFPPVVEFSNRQPSSIRAPKAPSVAPTTLYLVRHGRTPLTESKRISGRGGADPELSSAGQLDALRAARAVSQIGQYGEFAHLPEPTAVVTSPIMRTRQTAQFIASEISSEVLVDEAFAEISFGDWDGLTNAEVLAKYPTEYEAWRGSFELAPPNGESLSDFEHRVRSGLNKLLSARSGEAIVIVSHVMPIRALLKLALNGSVETYWRQTVNPCSLTILRFWDDATAEVIAANSSSHLI